MSETEQAQPKPAASAKPDSAKAEMAATTHGTTKNSAPRRKSAFALPKAWPGIFVLMLFAGLLGGGISVYWPNPAGINTNGRLTQIETRLEEIGTPAQTTAFDEDVEALRERLDVAEARLELLEESAAQAGIGQSTSGVANRGLADDGGGVDVRMRMLETDIAQSGETLRALGARVDGIETALPRNLAERLNSFALRSTQTALDARLADLEAANNGAGLRRVGAVLALANLSRAAMDARPFLFELDALAATAPDDAALAVLRPYARNGIPTAPQLAARFPAAARTALDVERGVDGVGLLARFWNGVTRLISVRRIGNIEGADTASRLARAQAALDQGMLGIAVGEVVALNGTAGASIAPWREDAEARLAVEGAVANIHARVVTALTPALDDVPDLPP